MVVVVGAIVYGFLPKAVSVDTAMVYRGPMKVTVEEEAKTRVRDRFVLSAPVAGFVRRISIDVGDRVEKGQTLAELEPLRSDLLDPRSRATSEAVVASAEASVRVEEETMKAARADAEYRQQALERSRRLFEDGLISRDAIEQVEAAAKHSRAALLASEAAVRVARSGLDRARATLRHSAAEAMPSGLRTVPIRAPVTGSILKIYRKSEGIIQPGEPLIDLGDPQKLEVKVEALSTDAVKISPGMPVLFERWGGEPPLAGTVRVVEPAGFTKISSLGVEEQRVPVIVDIASKDKAVLRLGDGYRMEASFIIWQDEYVLQVPASSLFRTSNGWAVFVVESGKAKKRDVRVGHRTGLAAEVLSGLKEGDIIVSHPDNSIEDGGRVSRRTHSVATTPGRGLGT
jgi:HlyD family secretion protein